MPRSHVIKDAKTERLMGALLFAAGAYLLWDAYEGRGQQRPFWSRFLPT